MAVSVALARPEAPRWRGPVTNPYGDANCQYLYEIWRINGWRRPRIRGSDLQLHPEAGDRGWRAGRHHGNGHGSRDQVSRGDHVDGIFRLCCAGSDAARAGFERPPVGLVHHVQTGCQEDRRPEPGVQRSVCSGRHSGGAGGTAGQEHRRHLEACRGDPTGCLWAGRRPGAGYYADADRRKLTMDAPTYPELDDIAKGLAYEVSMEINKRTAAVTSTMPYKAQYVLEELIKLLQEKV